jgi:hypothetical protein
MRNNLLFILQILICLYCQLGFSRQRNPAHWNDRITLKNFGTKEASGQCSGLTQLYASLYSRVAFDPSKPFLSVAELEALFSNSEISNSSKIDVIVVPGPEHLREFSDKYAAFLAKLAAEAQNQCHADQVFDKSPYGNACLTAQAYKSSAPNSLMPIALLEGKTGHALNFVDFSITEGSCESESFKISLKLIDPNKSEIFNIPCSQFGCNYSRLFGDANLELFALKNIAVLGKYMEQAIANREFLESNGLDQAKRVIRIGAGEKLRQEQVDRRDDPRIE